MRRTAITPGVSAVPPAGDANGAVGPDEPVPSLLPDWYMPAPQGGVVGGWRRLVAMVIVAAFALITAYGFCNTYGDLLLS